MLTITIPSAEFFDEKNNLFIYSKEQNLRLEHSLVSISKWEANWHKPFLSEENRTNEEMLDYIRCMTITQNVDPKAYQCIPKSEIERVNAYINDPRSATVFYDKKQKPHRKERITSEKIYFWMVRAGVPFDPCQTWHLNRLLNLLHYCNTSNQPMKKRSPAEIAKEYEQINAAQRKLFNSKG